MELLIAFIGIMSVALGFIAMASYGGLWESPFPWVLVGAGAVCLSIGVWLP